MNMVQFKFNFTVNTHLVDKLLGNYENTKNIL